MKMYELIKRLEHIRDKMESTFSNEFQRGEIDNLIEELIQMTPEVGQIEKLPQMPQPQLGNNPYWTFPSTVPYVYPSSITTTGGTITLNGNTSSSSSATYVSNSNLYTNCSNVSFASPVDANLSNYFAGTLEESKTLTVS